MILDPSYRDDMLEQLHLLTEQKPELMKQNNIDINSLDTDTVDRLWGLYQKSVQEYDVDPDYAAKDALMEVFSIPIEAWATQPAPETRRKLVYITSPYTGNIKRNLAFAKAAGLLAVHEGCTPIITHLMYPAILDDNNPEERSLGMLMDMSLVKLCNELWCFDANGISKGMQAKMAFAKNNNIPIVYRHERRPAGFSKFLAEG